MALLDVGIIKIPIDAAVFSKHTYFKSYWNMTNRMEWNIACVSHWSELTECSYFIHETAQNDLYYLEINSTDEQ